MVAMGTWISEGFGWNAVSIDGPAHGDRGPVQKSTDPAYREMWQRPDVVGKMVEDLKCVISAFVELDSTDQERIGFWGYRWEPCLEFPMLHPIRESKQRFLENQA